jgi:hypothetical protein
MQVDKLDYFTVDKNVEIRKNVKFDICVRLYDAILQYMNY